MVDNIFFFLKPKEQTSFFFSNLSIQDGLDYLRQHSFTIMPVITPEGHYIGSISEGDFLWYSLSHNAPYVQDTLKHLVRKDFIPACNINVDTETLFAQSLKQNYVPIVDDRNIFIGLVTRQSILKYLMENNQLDNHS